MSIAPKLLDEGGGVGFAFDDSDALLAGDEEEVAAEFLEEILEPAGRASSRSLSNLTAERVAKSPAGLDLEALLDRIESDMADAAPEARWTINSTLAEIGIHNPKLRKRAIKIGETLGAAPLPLPPSGSTRW